ncbi:hypothetical protein AMTR_s00005p00247070 [Amborella trichopoda]|uniref:Uncharacterized protein n=1 Tax=Amborella trichopoda TaxID=13333 RepID=W1PGV3_AMBTC|nr:hypothetical protein AMTR_s00005p00247070 [Amborella trichopoda]
MTRSVRFGSGVRRISFNGSDNLGNNGDGPGCFNGSDQVLAYTDVNGSRLTGSEDCGKAEVEVELIMDLILHDGYGVSSSGRDVFDVPGSGNLATKVDSYAAYCVVWFLDMAVMLDRFM